MLKQNLGWAFQRSKHIVIKGFGEQHLSRTNTLSCGILLAIGDFLQQKIEKSMERKSKYDFKRTARMFCIGLAQGPAHHHWYTMLDRLMPKRDIKTVGVKIIADQLFAAPFFAITFIIGMGLLQDKKLSECNTELKAKFPTIYIFDWCIWPPSQYINFKLIPPQFRVLYVQIITIGWDIFLSWVKHFDELDD